MSSSNPHRSALTFEEVRMVSPVLEKYTLNSIVNDLWKRPDLSARDRSIITVSALIARGQTIAMLHYFNMALDNGLKPSEVSEIVTHVAFYAGCPNAFAAVDIVKDILAQRGIGADQLPEVSPELLPLAQAVPDEEIRIAFTRQNFSPVCPGLVKFPYSRSRA